MADSISLPAKFLKRVAKLGAAVDDMETELLPLLMVLMEEDNEEGLLAGLDRYGRPLAKLAESTLKNRTRGSGGPLIPRYRSSRAIAHYKTEPIKQSRGVYVLLGFWEDVLSKPTKRRGAEPFLHHHFEGGKHLPIRDIRGVREAGKDRIRAAMEAWLLSA